MKFPEVELVHHIPHEEHPLGRYLAEKAKIELSRVELEKRDANLREFAVFHELGHWWRCERMGSDGGALPSIEDEEHFCDAFALYFCSPQSLEPFESELLSGLLKDDASLVDNFGRNVFDQLEASISSKGTRP